MARIREGSARPLGDRPAKGNPEARITVRCPNRNCNIVYRVRARHAGRRARCAECGTRTLIPIPRVSMVENTPAPERRLKPKPSAKNGVHPAQDRREVRIGAIGRGHAGKTALFQVLGESLVGDFLPSGLHLDAGDPREVARMIKEAEAAQRLLRQSGLPPTLTVSYMRYCIFEGDKPRILCRMREVIGQVLTHTMPDSEPRLQARYVDYIKSLVNANVLWVVLPCPPAYPKPNDKRRYANDLRITMAYLREALRLRTTKDAVAVALVLSKTDAMFEDAQQAREALTDDVLACAVGPLVHLIEQSKHVSDAAIIPTSAFGFGKAVLHPDAKERHEAPGSGEEPFGDEPIWLLKEGESPAPFNLDTLFLWSLLLGLMNKNGPVPDPKVDTLCRMLRDDLEAGEPWLVPIKGGVALASP
jgi:hypothetical protein